MFISTERRVHTTGLSRVRKQPGECPICTEVASVPRPYANCAVCSKTAKTVSRESRI